MTVAEQWFRFLCPEGTVTIDGGEVTLSEVFWDCDFNKYRMKYVASPDGQHCVAYCVGNPWSKRQNHEFRTGGHIGSDGFICLAAGITHEVAESPCDLCTALARGRYWTTAYSLYQEKGEWIDP